MRIIIIVLTIIFAACIMDTQKIIIKDFPEETMTSVYEARGTGVMELLNTPYIIVYTGDTLEMHDMDSIIGTLEYQGYSMYQFYELSIIK